MTIQRKELLEYFFIITTVISSFILIIILDTLDDNMPEHMQLFSNILQDSGYVCIAVMLSCLLIIQINTHENRLKLEKYEKEIERLKKIK